LGGFGWLAVFRSVRRQIFFLSLNLITASVFAGISGNPDQYKKQQYQDGQDSQRCPEISENPDQHKQQYQGGHNSQRYPENKV
jgi:hypothetical protein